MFDLYEEFRVLAGKLSERDTDYALCGGLAMAVYGIVRATVDIDLLIPAESLGEITTVAHELGYTLEAQPMKFAGGAIEIRRISKIDRASGDVLMLDLLLVTPQVMSVWETRTEVEWENGKVRVVSREGLIALKSLRGSGQDLDDIERLKESGNES